MPIIRISPSELLDVLKLPDEKETMEKIWEHILMNGFIFNEFTLVCEGFGFTYKTKIEGYGDNQKIFIKELKKRKDGLVETEKFETTIYEFFSELVEMLKKNKNVTNYKDITGYEGMSKAPPMLFMQYAVDKSMNREYLEMTTTQKRYRPIKERKKSKPKKEYKLFDVIRKYESHVNHNRHIMTCQKWDVKGHFRHYKSGKVVYIKPFEKGKGRKVDKEYRL